MLKSTIIDQRIKEVSESRSYLKDQGYREQFNKVDQAYDAIKCMIPNTIKEQFLKLFDEYVIANDKMHIIIEREVYKQGFIDGIEIKKLLTPRI
ncbi:MAG: hypothetical protein JG775_2550 [Defluviitaleaceae bacterium]|jgi:hypothetical protein|nr:hypothetical protein [Defluviitaleaceae bacterium]MBZ4688477.1 hypothetical protein [Clostridiales bacterium]